MSNNSYSYTILVSENEIDELNHVNNMHYLKYVQNAAKIHWEKLSNHTINKKYVWVVLRHEIDYIMPAKLNDRLTVTTWIGKSYGVKSERFVEIKKEDKIVIKAKTIWCLLAKKTMRPVRIPSEILQLLEVLNST